MTDSERRSLTLDPAYREAFDFLQSETRVDILLALAADLREYDGTGEEGLSFSTLRERVGVRDSGRFNYHLDKLQDGLVTAEDGRYVLTIPGMQAVGTLVAGAFATGETRDPTPIDTACPACGAAMVAAYERGLFQVTCREDDDHAVSYPLPPGAAEGRSTTELLDVMRVAVHEELGMSVQGVCPMCRGVFEWGPSPEHAASDSYRGRCRRCAALYAATPAMLALQSPPVVASFHDHGVDVRERHTWELGGFVGVERVSADPYRVSTTLAADGHRLRVVLDESARVVETERAD